MLASIMVLPNVLGIGAQKAGTSWLHENLKSNPGAWLPPFKELHFFDHKFIPDHRRWTGGHVKRGLRIARENAALAEDTDMLAYLETISEPPLLTRRWYRQVFKPCPNSRVGIDITPEYSSLPPEGVEFVRDVLGPDLKMIYIIRDPVDRALSQMRMYMGRRKRVPEAPEDWAEFLDHPDLQDRGNYLSHIPRWESVFPQENFLFLPYGMIATDPIGFLRRVESFCGLPAADYPRSEEKIYRGPTVEVPQHIRDTLADMLADQVAFLKTRFSADFVHATSAPASRGGQG